MLLFTDGITEAKNKDDEEFMMGGVRWLCATAR